MLEMSEHFVDVKANDGNIYAYNSIFGNLTKLSKKEIELIEQINKSEKINEGNYKNEIKKLKDKNFIKTVEDEYELIKPILQNYKEDVINGKSITKLLLYVTGNCMLRCSYCYIDDAQDMDVTKSNGLNCSKTNMSWDVAKKAIDTFYEIVTKNKQKKVHIRFHGGEPFINFKVIKQSIEYINEKFKDIEVVFHTNTNAIVMTDEIINYWIEKSNCGKHSTDLEISIDGPKECHDRLRKFPNGNGSYDKAIEVIKKLIDRGYPTDKINIAATLNKYNYKNLKELIDVAKSIGLKSVEINTLIFESEYDFLDKVEDRINCLVEARIYGAEQGVQVTGKWFKLLERLYKPVLNYCGRMGQQFAVDLDGNVFLCTGYFRNFGKIENWEKIIKDKEYINLALRIVGQLPECKNCPIECVCAGGCPASAESSYGSFYSKESKECEFRTKMVQALIKNIDKVSKIDLDEVDSSYVPTLEKYKKI